MKPPEIISKMVQAKTGGPIDELGQKELEGALKTISSLPLYFIDTYGEIGLDELKDAIYYSRRRYGVEVVLLDNLHFFLQVSEDRERQAIDNALKKIKSWAMELGIHIFLVVHPTKLTYDNSIVKLNDLKGSSGLKQIPDNVLSIWRPRGEDDFKNPTGEVVLHILKCRDDSGDEGKVILTFDKRSQSYSDPGPEGASSVEGRRNLGASSPKPRPLPRRDWANGYDK
jgi:replicative DNA helicase